MSETNGALVAVPRKLLDALRILAQVHTYDDALMGYRVAAAPSSENFKGITLAHYTDAWGIVRDHLQDGARHE